MIQEPIFIIGKRGQKDYLQSIQSYENHILEMLNTQRVTGDDLTLFWTAKLCESLFWSLDRLEFLKKRIELLESKIITKTIEISGDVILA